MVTLPDALTALTEKQGVQVSRLTLKMAAVRNPTSGFARALRRPLTLNAVYDQAYWVVSDRITLCHGTAPDLDSAVADYIADWEQRLRWLEEHESTLAAGSAAELATLRRLGNE